MAESSYAQEEAERRIAPRVRTLKRARVLFNNRFSTIDCVVRNMSRTGALLTVDAVVHLPKVFEIAVGEDEIRPARLVYRRDIFAGIHFTDLEPEEQLPNMSAAGVGDEAFEAAVQRIVPATLPVALVSRFPWAF